MRNKFIANIILILFAISIVLTLILSNKIGKSLENVEAGIYQKISGKKPQYYQYDSMGVPFVIYEGNLGKQYNTVTVAEQAIKMTYGRDTTDTGIFINCIKWLTTNSTILNDSSIIYLNNFNWESYKMTSPWRSAMAQGRAIQVFIKAFEKTGDTLYLNLARKSMNALYTEVKYGGVTYIDSKGYWYEEYADDNVPQSRVLNGMIVVLQALSDFNKVTNDPNARFLFSKGVEAVKNSIHLYDNNGHSNYDILGKPSSVWYHKFHIEQLGFLYNETNEPVFNEYMLKWEKYSEPSYLTSLYRKPTNIGIFTVFTIFISVFVFLFIVSYFLWFKIKEPATPISGAKP